MSSYFPHFLLLFFSILATLVGVNSCFIVVFNALSFSYCFLDETEHLHVFVGRKDTNSL